MFTHVYTLTRNTKQLLAGRSLPPPKEKLKMSRKNNLADTDFKEPVNNRFSIQHVVILFPTG